MTDTFIRHLLMLKEIPLAPQRIDTVTLAHRLEAQGVRVTMRTLQRDLERLSQRLPLRCHDTSRPYSWTWIGESEAPKSGPRQTLREVVMRTSRAVRRRG